MRDAARGGMVAYYDARVDKGRVRTRRSERVVFECGCGERMVLSGPLFVRRSGSVLECGCGERFTVSGCVTVRRSGAEMGNREARDSGEERRCAWLEGHLERLEGREAREEYYMRLEQVASR
jgi:hypothetical protein